MSRCEICNEFVDWNNPAIHYGGHVCNTKTTAKTTTTTQSTMFTQERLTWKDVFNGYKLYPSNYDKCLNFIKSTSYGYIAFNGRVYRRDDYDMKEVICTEDDLEK